MIGIGLLLLLFIVAALLLGKVTLIMFAHPGMLLIGAGVLLTFLLLAAFGVTYLSFEPQVKVATVQASPPAAPTAVQVPQPPQAVQQFSESSGVQTVAGAANWIKFGGGIWLIFVVGCGVAIVARRIFHPAGAHGGYRFWPVLLLIPVLLLFLLGTARYQVQVVHNPAFDDSVRRATAEMNARHQKMAQDTRERVERLQREAQSRVHQAQRSIQEEIDQFDAPRIPLSPDMPATTSAPLNAKPDPAHLAASGPVAPKAPDAPKQIDKSQSKNNSPEKATSKSSSDSSSKTKSKARKPGKARSTNAKTNETVVPSQPADSKDSPAPVAKHDANVEEDETAMGSKPDSTKPVAQNAAKSPAAKKSDKLAGTRPAWVDEPPKLMGDTQREVIATEEYATVNECRLAADMYLLLKTYQRVQLLAGRPAFADSTLPSVSFSNGQIYFDGQPTYTGAGNSFWYDPRLRALDQMGIDIGYIHREIVAKEPGTNETREYVETVDRSMPLGPMKKLYLQIEFTPAVDRDLRAYWLASQRRDRFAAVGVGGASVLGLIGLVFGLLKLDTWTKGYYSKRLFIGVPTAIIMVVWVLVVLILHEHF